MERTASQYAARLQSLDEHDLHPLRALLSRAVNEEAMPGVSVWLGVDQGESEGSHQPRLTQVSLVEGRYRFDGRSPLVSATSLYDLASLTKPLATARWCAELISLGVLDPERPIGEVISCHDPYLSETPIWRLLNHSAGLPAHREYQRGFAYSRMNGGSPSLFKSNVRRMIRSTLTEYIPGEKSIYSDLGYLLLEEICESVSGDELSQFWENVHPKGALHFRPLSASSSLKDLQRPTVLDNHYVPTELCSWRERILCGEVHDDNAWLMGGVCGHAGLFGSATELGLEALSWLRAYHGEAHERGLSPETVRWMFDLRHRAPQGGSFVLGWDTPSQGYSSAGSLFSRHTVGHLGFTGTSLWIDLERRVVMVILSNRVYPNRNRPESQKGIRWLRPAIHNELWRLLNE